MSAKLTAILLVLDPKEAFALKKFLELRDWEVHTVSDLDQCWRSLNKITPQLLIADVMGMSNAQRTLVDHPLIIHHKIPLAFYCQPESRPLLQSILAHWHLGIVEKSPEYATAMVPILLRLDDWLAQNEKYDLANAEISRLRRENQEMVTQMNALDFKLDCYQKIEQMDHELKKQLQTGEDFFVACAKILQQQNWVTHFAFYGLLENGRRLFSPDLPAGKCHALPELFLPVHCPRGLAPEAQAMAIQLFSNVGDGQLILLEIDQLSDGPKFLLLIKTPDRELFQHIEMDALERILDYNFQRFKPKVQQEGARTTGPWELASYLESTFHRLDEDLKLLGPANNKGEELGELMVIDLAPILAVVHSKKMGRFFWKKFAADLQSKLLALLGRDVQFVEMGLQTIYLLSPSNNIGNRLELVQNFLKSFALWRYFEQPNHTTLWGVTMTAKMVPLSPASIKEAATARSSHSTSQLKELH